MRREMYAELKVVHGVEHFGEVMLMPPRRVIP